MLRRYALGHPRLEIINVCGSVILGDTQFALNDLEFFTQKKLSLMARHFLLHFRTYLRLQARNFELLMQKNQYAFHSFLQRNCIQYLLKVRPRCCGDCRCKICQWRRVIQIKVIEEVFKLLVVQRVEWYQLLDRLNQRHGISFDFRCVYRVFGWVRYFGSEGGSSTQPPVYAESLHALRDELYLAIAADNIM